MKSTKFYATLMAVALCTASAMFTSCTPDEDVTPEQSQEQGEVTAFDQVDFFQNNIVGIDSLGCFAYRVYGAPLNAVDTTELYVGVENIEEAVEIFKSWMSPDTEVNLSSPSTINMEADLKDLDGQVQETVYFKAVDETPTLAEVTFAKGTVIKYVSKVIFIKNSAWPYNDESEILFGERASGTGMGGYCYGYGYCIREAKNGKCGLLLAISSYECAGTNSDKRFAQPELAKQASEALQKDWDTFVALFDGDLVSGRFYWIEDNALCGKYAIRLSDGKIDWFAFWKKKQYIKVFSFN